ncbi:MAG TPA: ATP-binding cassette domain-containing protein [Pyrinomonadaceae bacterium]|jgi:ABC-type dipeptide/oligopeptide/nickel transport system ATPase component
MSKTLLEVENLRTRFGAAKALDGVSFAVGEGEVLGIVGESGCGKSVTALSIMRLIESPGEICGGRVIFRGGETEEIDLLKLSEKQLEKILGSRISLIFQDP